MREVHVGEVHGGWFAGFKECWVRLSDPVWTQPCFMSYRAVLV